MPQIYELGVRIFLFLRAQGPQILDSAPIKKDEVGRTAAGIGTRNETNIKTSTARTGVAISLLLRFNVIVYFVVVFNRYAVSLKYVNYNYMVDVGFVHDSYACVYRACTDDFKFKFFALYGDNTWLC